MFKTKPKQKLETFFVETTEPDYEQCFKSQQKSLG